MNTLKLPCHSMAPEQSQRQLLLKNYKKLGRTSAMTIIAIIKYGEYKALHSVSTLMTAKVLPLAISLIHAFFQGILTVLNFDRAESEITNIRLERSALSE